MSEKISITAELLMQSLSALAVSGAVEAIRKASATTFANVSAGFASFTDGETPSGAIDGVNTSYSLVNTPDSGTLCLYHNGTRLRSGATNDFTLSGANITMTFAPETSDDLICDYQY